MLDSSAIQCVLFWGAYIGMATMKTYYIEYYFKLTEGLAIKAENYLEARTKFKELNECDLLESAIDNIQFRVTKKPTITLIEVTE